MVSSAQHLIEDGWKSEGSKPVKPKTKISDLVTASGDSYSLCSDNCHHSAQRMMDLGQETESD